MYRDVYLLTPQSNWVTYIRIESSILFYQDIRGNYSYSKYEPQKLK